MRDPRRPLCAAGFVVVVLAAAGSTLLAASAQAAPRSGAGVLSVSAAVGGERIGRYSVDLRLTPDGTMHVRETIDYDFASARRHGIERTIPLESRYDKDHYREYPIGQIKVSSPTGAPVEKRTTGGSVIRIRIGDPNNDQVTGRQTYVISYDVKGVVNSSTEHQELYWIPIGDQWPVPIAAPSVRVAGPATVQRVGCFQGSRGSTRTCQSAIGQDGAADFIGTALEPEQGVTVVASFAPGTFANAGPILKDRWRLAKAFSVTPVTVGASLVLLLLLSAPLSAGAALAVLRRGRRRDPATVPFSAPYGIRPGQLGTLIHQRARDVDITATIIDLGVRGFIRIEEAGPKKWKLIKLPPPGARAGRLRPYEAKLYDAIFPRGRKEVLLSSLKWTLRRELSSVAATLEADVTSNGWFKALPTSVRRRRARYGLLMAVGGAGLTGLLAAKTSYGLLGIAVLVSGIVLLVRSPQIPVRTAAGTAMLAQARGFQRYLDEAEAAQIRFEEDEDIFSQYLPFAIVFGVSRHWVKVFAAPAGGGTEFPTANQVSGWGWFYPYEALNYLAFIALIDAFSSTIPGSFDAALAFPATASSSSGSSGFAAGGYTGGGDTGGGGGGGGSW